MALGNRRREPPLAARRGLDYAVPRRIKATPLAHGGPHLPWVEGGPGRLPMKLSRLRRSMYRAGSALGDLGAISSGNPARIVKRAANKAIWRGWSRLFRALFGGR
jgi:hypothetical protein